MLALLLGGLHMTLSAHEWVDIALTLAAALVQAIILVTLTKRRMRSDFPVFFAYTTYAVLAGVTLAAGYIASSIRPGIAHYFALYWMINVLAMILEFGVMYELLSNALKPYAGLIDLGKMLFRWAAIFLLVAASLTAFATAGPIFTKCIAAVDLLEKSLRLMQCGLLLLFFLFERRLALSWRSYPVSLALGLGITAATGLSFAYMRTRFAGWTPTLDFLDNLSYFAVAVFWSICFALPEPNKKNVMDSPSRLIFQRWNETLASYGYGQTGVASGTVESFLPGIEKTVDRVLARKAMQ
jgi:hypothetical protein